MKNQALFSSKDISKNLKCCLLQFLSGALRVKGIKLEPTWLKKGLNFKRQSCFPESVPIYLNPLSAKQKLKQTTF